MARKTMDVTMSMPPSLVKRLDRLAKLQGVSRSVAACDLLAAALREGEDLVKVLSNDKVREALMRAMMQPGILQAMSRALGHELSASDRQRVFQFFEAAGAISGKGNA